MSKTAYVIVDLQYDFMDGTLAVPDAHAVVEPIIAGARHADLVVFTRDWHPEGHISFAEEPKFVDKSWPRHCVQGTEGAMIHPKVIRMFDGAPVFSKGVQIDREDYSGFAGYDSEGDSLDEYLHDRSVDHIIVVGLATDYCVHATAIDGASNGYDVTVFADCVRGVSPVTTMEATQDMVLKDVYITTSEEF